jgi:hypothetical protein
MASIVLGVGTSHSPLLALDGSEWEQRAADDFRSKSLNLSDGRYVSYGELSTITQDRYADVATSEQFIAKSARAQAALDRLADEIEACDPDVAIIVGDDQAELYSPDNMPAIAL